MYRIAAIFCLLAVPALAEDNASAPARDAASEARLALVEHAAAPLAQAKLPVLGIDPLRRARNELKSSPALQVPVHRNARGLAQSGADRARDPADRAADRALGGDRGPGGRGDGHRRGPDGRHDDHDHDGHRDDHDGPPPGGGGAPPHPP